MNEMSSRVSVLGHTWADVQARIGRRLGCSGTAARMIEDHPLKPGRVHRQVWRTGDRSQAVIVKRFTPERSRIERTALERWLPALQLADLAPDLLAVVGKPDADCLWHAYEDLGDGTLDVHDDQGVRDRGFLSSMQTPPEPDHLAAAVASLARLHRASANHPLLGEYRYWTGDLGGHFLVASVRDAIAALESLRPDCVTLSPHHLRTRQTLLSALQRLQAEARDRCAQLAAFGGPDCLLHGDFGVRNVVVGPDAVGRLIDWDHAGVGPASYDLSTFLLQLPPAERGAALERYREHRGCAAADWPDREIWNGLFDTAERARLANCVIWPVRSALDGDVEGAFADLTDIAAWFAALGPVLPAPQGEPNDP